MNDEELLKGSIFFPFFYPTMGPIDCFTDGPKMKWPLTIILPIFSLLSSLPLSARGEKQYPPTPETPERHRQHLLAQREGDLRGLKEIKYLMINGNLRQAEEKLRQFAPTLPKMQAVGERYLATLLLLRGQWAEALKIFSGKHLQRKEHYQKICPLKILAQIALGKRKNLQQEFAHCFYSLERDIPSSDINWALATTMIEKRPLIPLHKHNDDLSKVAGWIKLALYLKREKGVLEQLRHLPPSAYHHPTTRELIGFLHYRLGKKRKALELLRDIDSSNAHNIRGNVALMDGEDETAYQHFKLALATKSYSLNAIQRSLTLSWSLGDYANALSTMRLMGQEGHLSVGEKIFYSVLLTEAEQHQRAIEILLLLSPTEKKLHFRIVNELLAINYLFTKRSPQSLVAARKACKELNGLACHLLTQLSKWDNLGETLQEQGEKDLPPPPGINLKKLSGPALGNNNFEHEILFVEQKDIEQMDALSRKKRSLY